MTYPPSIGVSILFTHPPFFRFGIEYLISFRLLLLLLRINVRGFVNVIMYLALVGRVNALNRYSLFVGY